MYLPAFPEIAHELGTTPAQISLSVSGYFIGLALGQLVYGPQGQNGFGNDILAAILHEAPVGLVVIEAPSGRILLYNAEVERIWRRPLRAGEEIWEYRVGYMFHADGRPYAAGELPLAR